VVLDGLTGSGKTRVLREIARRFPRRVLDLEGLAQHRSSVLGDIGLHPVSQKAFESGLVAVDRELEGPWTLVEWEARKVGDRVLPASLFHALQRSPRLRLETPFDVRVNLLSEEYLAAGGVEEIARRLPSLRRFPGFEEDRIEDLQRDLSEGRTRAVAAALLELHYDPRYRHGSQEYPVERTFAFHEVSSTADEIVTWLESHCAAGGAEGPAPG
jgi:tRNA 2-selenouridine synthase